MTNKNNKNSKNSKNTGKNGKLELTKEEMAKISSKIQKLMMLATSPNEAEAEAAMNKAQALMEQYNIRELDVNEETKSANINKFEFDYRDTAVPKWELSLAQAIATNLDGHILLVVNRGIGSRAYKTLHMIGTPTELEFIVWLFKNLRRNINIMANQFYNENPEIGHAVSVKNSYKIGMVSKVQERLAKLYTKMSDCTDLMVIKSDALREYVDTEYGKVHNRNNTLRANNLMANIAGYQDGDKLSLNKPIANKKTHSLEQSA